MINVIDNSGAAIAECVKVLKMERAAKVGTFSTNLPTTSYSLHGPSTNTSSYQVIA